MNLHRKLTWLFLSALIIILFGCEADEDVEYVHPQLNLKFAPSAIQQTFNVTRIVVTIEVPDSDPVVKIFTIEPGQHSLDADILVPTNATKISVEAYEIDESGQERVAFKGESSLEDLTQVTPEISVRLDPATAHVKLEASKTDLAIGEIFTMEISVAEVKDLFAMSFELEFNSQLLEPNSVSPGTLFGENPIEFDDRDLNRPDENRLGIAIALRGGNTGVSGSGVVAVVKFQTKAAGIATVRVVGSAESEVFTLQQSNGEPVEDFERLEGFLTREEVVVNIK